MASNRQNTCVVDGCNKPGGARRLCRNHYAQAFRAGLSGAPPTVRFHFKPGLSDYERVMARVDQSDTGCTVWCGPRVRGGYGRISVTVNGRRAGKAIHRVVWEHHNGTIPDGLQVCHKCDNPPCCNIDHLFLGTLQDNMDDMIRKGRKCRGSRVNGALLTEGDVREIRRLGASGVRGSDIAKLFPVDRVTIYAILHRRIWKWVEDMEPHDASQKH